MSEVTTSNNLNSLQTSQSQHQSTPTAIVKDETASLKTSSAANTTSTIITATMDQTTTNSVQNSNYTQANHSLMEIHAYLSRE